MHCVTDMLWQKQWQKQRSGSGGSAAAGQRHTKPHVLTCLQESYGEGRVRFGCDPEAEAVVKLVSLGEVLLDLRYGTAAAVSQRV